MDDLAVADVHPRELLSAAELLEGLDELLGPRGLRCLEEAHHAYRAHLWLASANLVGAASEAAWFTVARAAGVGGLEAEPSLATVLAKTDRAITSSRGPLPALLATAHYLRDVRNYGLHPRDGHDADREVPFTEAGCVTLLLSSRRYFVQLADLHRRLSR